MRIEAQRERELQVPIRGLGGGGTDRSGVVD